MLLLTVELLRAGTRIVVDRTACARCKMLISDLRFAAALKTDRYFIFDDIGCMLAYASNHTDTSTDLWVRDYAAQKWLRSQDATFYFDEHKRTPMSYGFIAMKKGSADPSGFTLIGSVIDLRNKFASR